MVNGGGGGVDGVQDGGLGCGEEVDMNTGKLGVGCYT